MENIGIASIGIKLPSHHLDVRDLATFRGIDPDKFSIGLGCDQIALCAPDEDVVTLAVGAAERAIARWGGDPSQIGLLAVGTETAKDMSRPLSAWVADELNLRGRIRSYEVKHACYGGTLALRQALEWKWSGAAGDKVALVIAADVALYDEESGGEPTQGAGAVAFIVDDARVASVDLASFAFSEPAFDFWRPVGQPCPSVDGPLSLDCYNKAASECFAQLCESKEENLQTVLSGLSSVSFHVPFPKMVKKAAAAVAASAGLNEDESKAFYQDKIVPTMKWNNQCGNAYTAALWVSVARALVGLDAGQALAAFSYGSGFGAELLTLKAGPAAKEAAWQQDIESDIETRRKVSPEEYVLIRRDRAMPKAAE